MAPTAPSSLTIRSKMQSYFTMKSGTNPLLQTSELEPHSVHFDNGSLDRDEYRGDGKRRGGGRGDGVGVGMLQA